MENSAMLIKRLYNKTKREGECLIWQGAVDDRGYGNMGIESFKTERVHRLSYKLYYNTDLPTGCQVLHKCDNKLCINPEHLYLGTQAQNVKDAVDRGLFKPHPCRKLTFEQANEVRRLRSTENLSTYKLAEMFNVGRMVIRNITEKNMYRK